MTTIEIAKTLAETCNNFDDSPGQFARIVREYCALVPKNAELLANENQVSLSIVRRWAAGTIQPMKRTRKFIVLWIRNTLTA